MTILVKWDPIKVARDMEEQMVNGEYLFHVDECLSQSQIKSFFSRLAAKQRNDQVDVEQAVEIDSAASSSPVKHDVDVDGEQIKFGNIGDFDNDVVDDSELQSSSWHQLVDEARTILEDSSRGNDFSEHSIEATDSYRTKLRSKPKSKHQY